jgi:hypothetical protein
MCCCNAPKQNCQKPENLKGKPEDCTPQQIRQCHGGAREHPCAPGKAKRPRDQGTIRARKTSGKSRK